MSQNLDLIGFLRAIRRLARALDVHSSRINRESGLTLPQLVVLTCVRDLGEVTSRAIAGAADLSAPTVNGILDKLEAKGLIERYRSASDRRVVHTRLTDRGAVFLKDAPPPMGDAFRTGLMSLPGAERRKLLSAIEAVADMAAVPDPHPEVAPPSPARGS